MSVKRGWLTVVAVWMGVSGLCGLTVPDARAGEADELTPAALTAVKELFPAAAIVGVGRERENGVPYFEVVVRDAGERVEIEVTPDGTIGEVERVVAMADLPKAARDGILKLTAGGPVKGIERHEIRGVPAGGVFAPVDPPVILYEVAYEHDGVRKEIAVGSDGKTLRPADYEDDDSEDSSDDDDRDESSDRDDEAGPGAA